MEITDLRRPECPWIHDCALELWVGGRHAEAWIGSDAKADPSSRPLCFAIYNLSDTPSAVQYGKSIAVIGFVTPTSLAQRHAGCAFHGTGSRRMLCEVDDHLRNALKDTNDASKLLKRKLQISETPPWYPPG